MAYDTVTHQSVAFLADAVGLNQLVRDHQATLGGYVGKIARKCIVRADQD